MFLLKCNKGKAKGMKENQNRIIYCQKHEFITLKYAFEDDLLEC